MIFGLSAVPFFGAAGVAIDYGRVASAMTDLQTQADEAALAAVGMTTTGSTTSGQNTERQLVANAFLDGGLPDVDFVDQTTKQVVVDSSNRHVDVTVVGTVPLSLSAVLFASVMQDGATVQNASVALAENGVSVKVHSRATCTEDLGPPACISVMDPTATEAFKLDSTSAFNAGTCTVNVQSSAAVAARAISTSSTKFSKICAMGGVQGNTASLNMVAGCPSISDPWANAMPTVDIPAGCNSSGASRSGTYSVTPGSSGVYTFCGNNTLGGSKVTLNPGLYIVKDGALTLSASTVIANGVSFYFPSTNSTIVYKGKEGNSLKAPTSGPYKGLLMFSGPEAGTRSVTIGSADKTTMEGIIHAPNWNLTLDSTSDWSTVADSKLNIVTKTFFGKSISKLNLKPYTTVSPSGSTDKVVYLDQ